jgi:cytochrome c oxidase subunit IV
MTEQTHSEHAHTEHGDHGDTFTVPWINKTMTLPGGIYTFIFGVLAVLTAIEVALTYIEENALIVVILIVMSLAKALLVVTFYMHLRTDNPLYRVVVLLPLLIVLVSVIYLIFVPTGPGLGYQ